MICWVLAMEILQGVWKQHLRPRAVVGYGIKFFRPSPPNYVNRSPDDNCLNCAKIAQFFRSKLTLKYWTVADPSWISLITLSGYSFPARYFICFIVEDVMHGCGIFGHGILLTLFSLVIINNSHVFISVGRGISANTTSMLIFCISRNCRMNRIVWSRLVSKILLTTFASTACLSEGNLERQSLIASWTILRRVFSTFFTRLSALGNSWSTGASTGTTVLDPSGKKETRQ